MQDLLYWVWLARLNLSPKARTAVLRDFGDAENAFSSGEGAFHGRQGITPREAELLEQRDPAEAQDSLRRCEIQGLEILPWTDSRYPACLRTLYYPPAVLFVKGSLPEVDSIPTIAVIGTRNASPYGLKLGAEFAREISDCGGTVISLLTSGVDEAAARGALLSGRPCIGVLGTPHENCRISLADDIAACGALVSEYPPGRECSRHFFRERNRLAAGLSDGVLVIEAPEKSGTRLFVMDAVEQGKDVFAVPGNIDAANAAGTLSLLKEGAKLVTAGADVMEEYLPRYPGLISLIRRKDLPEEEDRDPGKDEAPDTETLQDATSFERGREKRQRKSAAPAQETMKADVPPEKTAGEKNAASGQLRQQLGRLSEDQLKIIASIDSSSSHVDDIIERTGLPAARVLAQLTVLEIKGFVRREAGRRFLLNISLEK